MNTGPRIATNPLDLLTPDPDRIPSILSKAWAPSICATVAVVSSFFGNYAVRRPMLSGIQRHILAGVIGVAVGNVLDDWKNKYLAERDAVLRHYVELHPEDFPPVERKKFSEVLLHWTPIR